jgi:hypothetical protein
MPAGLTALLLFPMTALNTFLPLPQSVKSKKSCGTYRINFGLQTAPLRGVTLPQLSQTYFMSATIGAQT